MYKVYAGIDWILLYVTNIKVDLNQNFRRSLHGNKDKAIIENCKKILKGGQKMASYGPWVTLATP